MTDTLKLLRLKARCGSCGGKLDRPLNLVELNKRARWKHPTAGNVITGESGKAVAVLCNSCLQDNSCKIVEAVEVADGVVKYHDIATLEDIPVRKCRACGCTEHDCRQCIARTGKPCFWVEDDFCSACVVDDQLHGQQANDQAAIVKGGGL